MTLKNVWPNVSTWQFLQLKRTDVIRLNPLEMYRKKIQLNTDVEDVLYKFTQSVLIPLPMSVWKVVFPRLCYSSDCAYFLHSAKLKYQHLILKAKKIAGSRYRTPLVSKTISRFFV